MSSLHFISWASVPTRQSISNVLGLEPNVLLILVFSAFGSLCLKHKKADSSIKAPHIYIENDLYFDIYISMRFHS